MRDEASGKIIQCPVCSSTDAVKRGHTSAGKKRYQCRCGRTFVADPHGVDPLVRELAERLIREDVSVPIIARAFKGHASSGWLYELRRYLRG